jgi:hypothetical protein
MASNPPGTILEGKGQGGPATVRKFIVERELPKIGRANRDELRAAASRSNKALHRLAPSAQWIQSYVAESKTFCVYLAEDEEATRRHAELSGIPASRITQAGRIIDPTTAARA